MDSVFDRWGEALVYVGLVGRPGRRPAGAYGPFLAAAAMAAAFLVSYARAKSEGLGFSAGTGMAAVGVMPREIRLVILVRRPRPRRACSAPRPARRRGPGLDPDRASS